jgi:hypothetical protein
MADHTSDEPAIETLISRLARFEPINLTALMLNESDNNPTSTTPRISRTHHSRDSIEMVSQAITGTLKHQHAAF